MPSKRRLFSVSAFGAFFGAVGVLVISSFQQRAWHSDHADGQLGSSDDEDESVNRRCEDTLVRLLRPFAYNVHWSASGSAVVARTSAGCPWRPEDAQTRCASAGLIAVCVAGLWGLGARGREASGQRGGGDSPAGDTSPKRPAGDLRRGRFCGAAPCPVAERLLRSLLLLAAVGFTAASASDVHALRLGHSACIAGFRQAGAVLWDIGEPGDGWRLAVHCSPRPFVFLCAAELLTSLLAYAFLAVCVSRASAGEVARGRASWRLGRNPGGRQLGLQDI